MVAPIAFFMTGLFALIASYFYLRGGERQHTGQAREPATPAPPLDLKEEEGTRLATTDVIATADDLPTLVRGHRAPAWWGIAFLILIDAVVFITLITSYFYFRAGTSPWPPDGIPLPNLLLPGINLLILLASAPPMYWALQRIRAGDPRGLRIGLAIGMLLGVIFLAIQGIEYSQKPYTWYTNAYGSIVWTIAGLHSAHVLAAILKSAALWVVAWQGYFNGQRHVAIEGNTLFWLFVAIIWIPLFLTLYIAPYVV